MSFFTDVSRATRAGFNRMIEARERQARRYVNGVLLHMDDESLTKAGYRRETLEKQGSTFFPL